MIEGITLKIIIWCVSVGIAGQALHSFIGLYKLYTSNTNAEVKIAFDIKRFVLGLCLGAVIGLMFGLFISPTVLTKKDLLIVFTASYSGVDFIEGFLVKKSNESVATL